MAANQKQIKRVRLDRNSLQSSPAVSETQHCDVTTSALVTHYHCHELNDRDEYGPAIRYTLQNLLRSLIQKFAVVASL